MVDGSFVRSSKSIFSFFIAAIQRKANFYTRCHFLPIKSKSASIWHKSLCVQGLCFSLFVQFMFSASFIYFHLSPFGGLRARLHSSSSVPNFLKFQFLAPVQEYDSTGPKSRYTHVQQIIMCVISVSCVVLITAHHFKDYISLYLNGYEDILYKHSIVYLIIFQ